MSERDNNHGITRRRVLGTGLTGFAAASLGGFVAAGLTPARALAAAAEKESWKNWSGAIEWTPRTVVRAETVDELVAAVRTSIQLKETLRVAGTGHSFVPLCATSGTTALLTRMARDQPVSGIEQLDDGSAIATVAAGAKLSQLTDPLFDAGFALETLPDIDRQSVAGATATATHGTGQQLGSLSSLVTGARLIDGSGTLREFDLADDAATVRALQVHLGALGLITHMKLRVVPRFRLHEKTSILPYEEAAAAVEESVANNRHFEFFWVSDRDACLVKTLNPTDEPTDREEFADETRLVGERVGWSGKIFPSSRTTRFNELEYAVPFTNGKACWAEIRQLMLGKYKAITWPLEFRVVAPDSSYLGMNQGRQTITLSLHQAAGLEFEPFFRDVEAVARNHGGRPHWGKMHFLTADQLAELYPDWQAFQKVRQQLDPTGVFQTPYLQKILG